jgi:ADP-glucose pyrophosphorylase
VVQDKDLADSGVYVFTTGQLLDALNESKQDHDSSASD